MMKTNTVSANKKRFRIKTEDDYNITLNLTINSHLNMTKIIVSKNRVHIHKISSLKCR